MRLTDQGFDDVVGGFYRAASGSTSWAEALRPFKEAVSATAIHLHGVDVEQGSVSFSHVASDMPGEAEIDYIRTYHQIDPRAGVVMGLQPGEWMNCWERFDDDFVSNDPFYQDFLIPYGGRYVSGAKLLQDGPVHTVLGVHRGPASPRMDADGLALCQRLAGHLTQALKLHRDLLKQRHQTQLGAELLNRLRSPILLVDEHRHVLHANPAAQALISTPGPLSMSAGRLYCRRAADDANLLLGLRQLLGPSRLPGATPPSSKLFLRAGMDAGKPPLGLYAYAMRPAETLHAFGHHPLAMLLVHDVDGHLELDPFMVAAAFDLTPAEARVAVAAANGQSPEEIATAHHVTKHTVRTQLASIFLKTRTTRQAELVSVLAQLPAAALGMSDA